MPLTRQLPPVRIELSTPGEWVDVKARLSQGDVAAIQNAAFRFRARVQQVGAQGANPDVDVDIDVEATTFIGLERGIVAWSFAEPVTPDNIRDLDTADYEILTERTNALWQPRSDDERKNSSANGQTRSLGAVLSPANSDGL